MTPWRQPGPAQVYALHLADEAARVLSPELLDLVGAPAYAAELRAAEPVTSVKQARRLRRAVERAEKRAISEFPHFGGDRRPLLGLAFRHAWSALNSAAGDDEYAKLLCREGAPADTLYARAAEDVEWLNKLLAPSRRGDT